MGYVEKKRKERSKKGIGQSRIQKKAIFGYMMGLPNLTVGWTYKGPLSKIGTRAIYIQ